MIFLGAFPFMVSDNFTHISYINRLIVQENNIITGAWLPGEVYSIKFSPHHFFLSIIGRQSNGSALDTWVAAELIFPGLLLISYLSFITTVFPNAIIRKFDYLIYIIIFILLYENSDLFYRGAADYKIVNCILLFQICRIFLSQLYLDLRFFLAGIALSFVVAITHPVEILILLGMVTPYSLYKSFNYRKDNSLKLLFVWIFFAIFSTLIVIKIFYTGGDIPLDRLTTREEFEGIYYSSLKNYIGLPVLISFFISLCCIYRSQFDIFKFSLLSTIAAIFLSPINPLIIYLINIGGSNIAWRTIFILPTYVAIAASIIHIKNNCLKFNKFKFSSIGILFIITASIGSHIYTWWHFDGTLGYQRSDAISQLKLQPNLYNAIKKFTNEIILTDTWTSAPINAISNNFIVAHRPWSEGPKLGRHQGSMNALKNIGSESSTSFICDNNISMIIINNFIMPKEIQDEFVKYDWLFNGFYKHDRSYIEIKFLKRIDTVDDADIYKVDLKSICL